MSNVFHEMYDDFESSIDKQHIWARKYKMDPIRLGRMCEQFPALQKSWNEFKLVYELCRSQDDVNRKIS